MSTASGASITAPVVTVTRSDLCVVKCNRLSRWLEFSYLECRILVLSTVIVSQVIQGSTALLYTVPCGSLTENSKCKLPCIGVSSVAAITSVSIPPGGITSITNSNIGTISTEKCSGVDSTAAL